MSALGKFCHRDDCVVITLDIEDCPLVEIPLSEVYDIVTSSLVGDYLNVLQDYVTQILEDTPWLCKQSTLHLVCTPFGTFYRRNDAEIISMRKPALQRLITQHIHSRPGIHNCIEIPVFIRFLRPKIDLPRKTRFSTVVSSQVLNENTSRQCCIAATPEGRVLKSTDKCFRTVEVFGKHNPITSCFRAVPTGTDIVCCSVHIAEAKIMNHDDITGDDASTDTCILDQNQAPAGETTPFGGLVPLNVINTDHDLKVSIVALGFNKISSGNNAEVIVVAASCPNVAVESTGDDFLDAIRIVSEAWHVSFSVSVDPMGSDFWPTSTVLRPLNLSLPSVLMRYHPIDRGRCSNHNDVRQPRFFLFGHIKCI
jgi:hypothetical protein